MKNIKYVSLFFRLLFQNIFVCVIALYVIGWIYAPHHILWFHAIPTEYQAYVQDELAANTKVVGFLIMLIPTLLELLVLYFLIRLFRLYEKQEIFSARNVRYIKYTGYALLVEQLVKPICIFLLGFILTSNNPPGMRYAMMTISGTNIEIILTAIIIILISWIMAEGRKLNEEQQLTI